MATTTGSSSKNSDLRRRIFFTIAMLAIYRIGIYITVPGVDPHRIAELVKNQSQSFLGLFNMFSGGALEKFSIFALGVVPYITASIIFQLLTVVVPALDQIQKEGDQGRKKINQYTRYTAVLIALVQGLFLVKGSGLVENITLSFTIRTMVTLATGTALVMWIGEQITERGIGNGISLIIFSGIVARLPGAMIDLYKTIGAESGAFPKLVLIGLVVVSVIAFIIYCERGYRKIPIQYAKRVVGNREYAAQNTHLPLKINVAGVIPPIFASALLMFPGQIASFLKWNWLKNVAELLSKGHGITYYIIFIPLVIFFCYFYTAVTFNPVDVADRLKKDGGFIPGIRPGKSTEQYIDKILSRLTLGGALYIAAVCILPTFLQSELKVPFYFGGTSLLIVVGTALDTVQQIQDKLIDRNYGQLGGTKAATIRGRGLSSR